MPVKYRQAEFAQALFEILPGEPPGLPLAEVRRLVEERVPLTPSEQAANNFLGGWTVGPQKAGWLVKSRGYWWATDEGRAAAAAYREDPEGFYQEWNRLYHAAVGGRTVTRRQPARLSAEVEPPSTTAESSSAQENFEPLISGDELAIRGYLERVFHSDRFFVEADGIRLQLPDDADPGRTVETSFGLPRRVGFVFVAGDPRWHAVGDHQAVTFCGLPAGSLEVQPARPAGEPCRACLIHTAAVGVAGTEEQMVRSG
jgi:hypothetical protein